MFKCTTEQHSQGDPAMAAAIQGSLQVPSQQLKAGFVGNDAFSSYRAAPYPPPVGSFAATSLGTHGREVESVASTSFMPRLMLIVELQTFKVINHNELFLSCLSEETARVMLQLQLYFNGIWTPNFLLAQFENPILKEFSVSLLSPVIHSPLCNCMN